jgi:phosphoribosylformylglycinamidine synthase
MGIESHNHPSYVDPYDGAATGVGGIVRDTLSMGAYPIALTDSLYFGDFDAEHSRYLLEGVVEGISDYGNSIGVPTVGGSVSFHPGYEGNPLVNVACVGLVPEERLVTADAKEPGNKLVLVGNATGRDGLGGASFASDDLAEDAETEDRPAVQVGDPYTEKLLIEANEELVEADLVTAARDLGAAGLGGASSEMIAKGGLGAEIELEAVHQREPEMNAMEILLAESQERMCYEVAPQNVEAVEGIAAKYELGCSVIGEVTEGERYVCTFEGETVVDTPAEFLADGAPLNDLPTEGTPEPAVDLPSPDPAEAFDSVVAAPDCASKRWVYRQYDHEVGARTSVKPGDDAALVAIREAETGLALSAGAMPYWTDVAPYEGARAVAIENATNLAAKGAEPLAAVDCLNGGNPEKPDVYGGFSEVVSGLAAACSTLDVPVVGGNVSLYNDSAAGPIPPTPTLMMAGTKPGYDAPPAALAAGDVDSDLLLVGPRTTGLGGSEYLARVGGSDAFPELPAEPKAAVEGVRRVAELDSTAAVHDVSDGGLAVALAEMVTASAGADVSLDSLAELFSEASGRVVVASDDPAAVREAAGDVPVSELGRATEEGALSLTVAETELTRSAGEIADLRATLRAELD